MTLVHHRIRQNGLSISNEDIDIIILEENNDQVIPSLSRYISLSHNDVYDLETFDCSENNLTSLPDLPYLQHLYCNHNNLIDIKTTGLNDLWSLNCSHNQLTNLPDLSSHYLESIYCDHNYITFIQLGREKEDW